MNLLVQITLMFHLNVGDIIFALLNIAQNAVYAQIKHNFSPLCTTP